MGPKPRILNREHSVMKLLKGKNIHPVGGTGGDGITKTRDFLKDRQTNRQCGS